MGNEYYMHTSTLPFSMPGKAAGSALLNSPLGLWVSLKIKDFKYILHDLVSKINIKFKKIYIYRKERKIFVHFIVSKTYSKLLRLHMPRFLLKKAKPGYACRGKLAIFLLPILTYLAFQTCLFITSSSGSTGLTLANSLLTNPGMRDTFYSAFFSK